MITRFLRHVVSTAVDLLEERIERVFSVEEFLYADTRGVQAKATTRIRVEEDSPVVEFLAEYDERVGYRFAILCHASVRFRV